MPREDRFAKAARLFSSGRLTVTHVGPERVEATVQGDSATYEVGYASGRGWFCTCPAWGRDCSHLIACVLVTVPSRSEPR
ncbi:MAG: hypothetical protein ACRDPP_00035 [Gaiellaceae bacterium]